MTKLTDDLRKAVAAEKGSMTTAGLAEKFKLSHSTIRRIIRASAQEDEKKSAQDTILMSPPAEKEATPKVSKAEEKGMTVRLEGFTTKDTSGGKSGGLVGLRIEEPEKLFGDEEDDTKDFINQIQSDDDEGEEEADEEADEEEKAPYLFGEQSASNGRLNSMATRMETDELEASEAVMRLLAGEDDLPASTPGLPAPKRRTAKVAEPDDEEVRAKLLSRIYLNVINFKDHLPFIKNQEKFLATLHKKNNKELNALANLIETQRSLGNVKNQMKHLFQVGCQGAEMLSQQYLGMDTQGFTQDMFQKQHELDMIFHELAIEQAEQLRAYTTPAMRLGLLFTSTLMMTDNKNKIARQKLLMEQKPAPEGLKQAYQDL